MSALSSRKLNHQRELAPFCEMPNCRTTGSNGGLPRCSDEQMFLAGHPMGWYCTAHAREIRAAYDGAHTPVAA